MKKSILILGVLFFIWGLTAKAQTNNQDKGGGYCILKVYGNGWSKKDRGIYIAYEDAKVEKKDFTDSEREGIMKATMENIAILRSKGYILVSSSFAITGNWETNEYVFKKDEK